MSERFRGAMSIEDFFNPAAENSYTPQELTDEEIIALVQSDENETNPEEECFSHTNIGR